MINDHEAPMKLKVGNKSAEWKIELTIQVNFICSKDNGETCVIRIWSDNAEIMLGSKTDDIINRLIDSILQDHQKELQSINKSEFAYDSVNLLYYHLHRISLKREKPYIKSPEWLENKRATINPKNDDDNCFQYAITAALNYNEIKKDLQRISNTMQYGRKDIDFSSHLEDWEKFE